MCSDQSWHSYVKAPKPSVTAYKAFKLMSTSRKISSSNEKP